MNTVTETARPTETGRTTSIARAASMARPSQLVVPRPAAGQLRLRPNLRGRGFVVGSVDANGPDTVGFANKDRVAWRDTSTEVPELLLMDQDDVLGVPGWITDQQVVDYLGAGLIARALMRSSRPVSRGDAVRVISTDPLVSALVAAWVRSLGAQVVDQGPALILEYSPDARRRQSTSSHGKLAQAAVDVFQAIRAGVFDGIEADSAASTAA